jgi:hypothetical protein
MTHRSPNLSLKDLLSGISTDVQLLATQTIALARLEASAAAAKLAWSAVAVIVSVFIGLAGAAVLVSALVLIVIALGLPAWAAASLVGVVLTVAGGLSARHFVGAVRQVELDLKATRQSLRETMEWLKVQTGS